MEASKCRYMHLHLYIYLYIGSLGGLGGSIYIFISSVFSVLSVANTFDLASLGALGGSIILLFFLASWRLGG